MSATEQDFERFVRLMEKFGWSIAIPEVEEDAELPGLIVGSDEYIETILSYLPEGLFGDLFSPPNKGNGKAE